MLFIPTFAVWTIPRLPGWRALVEGRLFAWFCAAVLDQKHKSNDDPEERNDACEKSDQSSVSAAHFACLNI
jgi:hypothetical protein